MGIYHFVIKDNSSCYKLEIMPFIVANDGFSRPVNRHLGDMTFIALTHWGRVTHICVIKQTIIGSDNGLSPGRRQAIIWTNAGILLIWPLETNFSENLIENNTFSFKKMHLKMSSGNGGHFVSASMC